MKAELQDMVRGGRRARGASVLFITALALAAPARAPAEGDTVAITIEAPGSLTQGETLSFTVIVENRLPVAVVGTVDLSVAIGDDQVPFDRWSGRADALTTVRFERAVTTAQWFPDPGDYTVRADGTFVAEAAQGSALAQPAASHAFTVGAAGVPVPRFEDVTRKVGLHTRHRDAKDCTNHAAGAAWGDIDDDGDLDLFLPHRSGGSELFVNENGRFVERARRAGVTNGTRQGNGAVFADYDNDGDQDLYVVNNGPNRLYRNDGSGRFKDVSKRAKVGDQGPGTSASWGDYDGDGLLDLYVTNHGRRSDCAGMEFTPFPNALYHNEGNGTFRKVNHLLPLGKTTNDGLGFQAAWLDYDGDDDLDLYLANDRIRPGKDRANILWRNDGRRGKNGWRFTDVSEKSGAGIAQNSMGIGVGDPDRDGDLDLAISNMMETALLENRRGKFHDIAGESGVARPMQNADVMSITWGLAFADLNGDGWEDLVVGAGDLETSDGTVTPQPNAIFVNGGGGRFHDLSAPSGADDPAATRGIALADYDRDGRMDIYAVNQAGVPRLYRNVTPRGGRHWLEVDVLGSNGNRDACGATVRAVLADGTTMVRQVFCGSVGLGSGCDRVVHFGLGSADRVSSLTIEWPSGDRKVLTDVPADRLMTISPETIPEATRRAAPRVPGPKVAERVYTPPVAKPAPQAGPPPTLPQPGQGTPVPGEDPRLGTPTAPGPAQQPPLASRPAACIPGQPGCAAGNAAGALPWLAVTAVLLGALGLARARGGAVGRRIAASLGIAGPGRAEALAANIFGVALFVQVFHFAEHIAQVTQKHVLHHPKAHGLLGSIFDTEWVHFIYNTALLAALVAIPIAAGAGFRARWRGAHPTGWNLLVATLLTQGYHVVEHSVKIVQHVATGAAPAAGILGRSFDLVWLHFWINAVVSALMVAAFVGLRLGERLRALPEQAEQAEQAQGEPVL